ncbi:MAG: hypothetical protein IPM54_24435 [Polyangiaceae bacterium]|nr:hypothetical protein [Polyangiaceae bacterium]
MKRILLIVTGDLEKKALADSLERLLRASGCDVEFDPPLKVPAITTTPLPDPSASAIPTAVRNMAKALVEEALRGRRGNPPDLVIGIDDLELANVARPNVVIAWIKRGVNARIDELYPSQDANSRVRAILRDRCSFHLLVPMVESYFYGHRAALTAARVALSTPVYRVGDDVEAFETDDPEFLRIAIAANEKKRSKNIDWWFEERHPKNYLDFLIQRIENALPYDELSDGGKAFGALDWPTAAHEVLAARASTTPPQNMAFARALFEDLAEFFSVLNPLGQGTPHYLTYPTKRVRREALTLRNL